jgi:hypothetical protein
MDVRQIIGEDMEGSETIEIDASSFAFENLERELVKAMRPAVQQVANAIARGIASGLESNPRARRYFGIEDLSDLNNVFESRLTRLFLDSAYDKVGQNVVASVQNLEDIASLAEAWAMRLKAR